LAANRALFLDRDGVINVDYGYVYKPDDIVFVDGIFELVEKAKKEKFMVVVITNQAGIGKGYYSETDFYELMSWMKDKFVKHGGKIDAVYFCPFHLEGGIGYYKKGADCRKPKPGMILKAELELNLDLSSSILIGDKISDIEAGLAAGVGNNFLLNPKKQDKSDPLVLSTLFEVIPMMK